MTRKILWWITPFSTRSHSLTPLFYFVLTQWPPFWIIHNKFWTISHRMITFLTTFRQNFPFSPIFFFKNVSKFVFCLETLPNLSNSHRLTPRVLSSDCMNLFLSSKVNYIWGGAGIAQLNLATPTYEPRTRPLYIVTVYLFLNKSQLNLFQEEFDVQLQRFFA